MTAEISPEKTKVTIYRAGRGVVYKEIRIMPDDPKIISKPLKWPVLSVQVDGITNTSLHSGGT